MSEATRIFAALGLSVVLVGLSGCGRDMSDLQTYIEDTKARPGGRIEPLPEITPYDSHEYSVANLRPPFVPDTPAATSAAGGGGPRPDENRSREFLEQFSLDTLRMVGTLDLSNNVYGLVQTNDGLIHRVVVGNYMGQNDGKIVSISESEINLVEIISDGLGGYLERPAAVALSD
jgi:type IV pilus assembly protein PilP